MMPEFAPHLLSQSIVCKCVTSVAAQPFERLTCLMLKNRFSPAAKEQGHQQKFRGAAASV